MQACHMNQDNVLHLAVSANKGIWFEAIPIWLSGADAKCNNFDTHIYASMPNVFIRWWWRVDVSHDFVTHGTA